MRGKDICANARYNFPERYSRATRAVQRLAGKGARLRTFACAGRCNENFARGSFLSSAGTPTAAGCRY
jgi:hypothetical protein